jgi:hypothetical protein
MKELKTEKYRTRHKYLVQEFDTNWREHFIDLSDYLMPRRGRFLNRDMTANDGNKRNSYIIDGTATRALRILAAGMQSGLTSPARPWFKLGLQDKGLEKYGPVRNYLDEVEKRMRTVFTRSNFYSTLHSVYGELGCFGTAAMFMGDDFYNVIRCYPFTIGEYVIATDSSLRVNTFYRQFPMTAINVVNTFGKENVSEKTVELSRKNKDKWVDVIHAVELNSDRDARLVDRENMEYASVYYEKNAEDKNTFLRISGFRKFPVMAPRWDTTGSEVYGRSPGMEVLPDVMMLQKMQEKKLKALDKLVDPPMNADPALREQSKTITSGGVTYVDPNRGGGQVFSPTYQIRPDFKAIQSSIGEVKNDIKEGLYNDLFLMLALSGDKEMTAREVAERHEEKLLSVGPVVERLQPELLDKAIDLAFYNMDQVGMLPDAPMELGESTIEIEYIGLLAQAQKMVGVAAVQQTTAFAGNLIAVWPEAKHKINPFKAIDEVADMSGAPAGMIVPDEEALARVDAENKAMQQQQQMEGMMQAAQGAKTLSETDLEKNSALKALTGGASAA